VTNLEHPEIGASDITALISIEDEGVSERQAEPVSVLENCVVFQSKTQSFQYSICPEVQSEVNKGCRGSCVLVEERVSPNAAARGLCCRGNVQE